MKAVPLNIPEGCNIILGQTHFIKTAEDLYEVIVTTVPQAQFGLAFAEALKCLCCGRKLNVCAYWAPEPGLRPLSGVSPSGFGGLAGWLRGPR